MMPMDDNSLRLKEQECFGWEWVRWRGGGGGVKGDE